VRFAIAFIFLTACTDHCGHDSAPVESNASPTTAALPAPSASVVEGDASPPIDSGADTAIAIDAGCLSAHDDAVARFHKFCANEANCHDDDPELVPNIPDKVPDLDGDGIPEVIWGWGPIPVNNESHLYKGGTSCAVHLGELGGPTEVKTKSTRHEGYRDIVVRDYGICEGASGGCTPEIDGYIFHAGQYAIDPKQHVDGTVKLTPEAPQ